MGCCCLTVEFSVSSVLTGLGRKEYMLTAGIGETGKPGLGLNARKE